MLAKLLLATALFQLPAFASEITPAELWQKGQTIIENGTKSGKMAFFLNPVVCGILETGDVYVITTDDFRYPDTAYLNLPEGIEPISKKLLEIQYTSPAKYIGNLVQYSILLPAGKIAMECVSSAAQLE